MDPRALNGAQFSEFGISVPTRSTGKWATDAPLPPPRNRYQYVSREEPGEIDGEQGTLGYAVNLPEPWSDTAQMRDDVFGVPHQDLGPLEEQDRDRVPEWYHDYGHKKDLPAPDLESRTHSGYTLTSHTMAHQGRIVLAWHGDNAVGRLDVSAPGHEGGGTPPVPEMISVHPDHRDKGLARSMFRFAQFTGPHEDPTRNLSHSRTRTSDGWAYSSRAPDNPDEDPTSRVRWDNLKRSAQFHQGRLF